MLAHNVSGVVFRKDMGVGGLHVSGVLFCKGMGWGVCICLVFKNCVFKQNMEIWGIMIRLKIGFYMKQYLEIILNFL